MKVLFVCNLGKQRSPTAARLWHDLYGDETDYMGVYADHPHKEKLEWADKVFVMEPHHRQWIGEKFPEEYLRLEIICLGVPDHYLKESPELVNELKRKFRLLDR